MAIIETISYALMFVVTFVFSIITIGRLLEKGNKLVLDWLLPILEILSAICWIILVPLHLAFVAGNTSAFVSAPAILWFALGIVFILFTLKSTFENLAVSAELKNAVDQV